MHLHAHILTHLLLKKWYHTTDVTLYLANFYQTMYLEELFISTQEFLPYSFWWLHNNFFNHSFMDECLAFPPFSLSLWQWMCSICGWVLLWDNFLEVELLGQRVWTYSELKDFEKLASLKFPDWVLECRLLTFTAAIGMHYSP